MKRIVSVFFIIITIFISVGCNNIQNKSIKNKTEKNINAQYIINKLKIQNEKYMKNIIVYNDKTDLNGLLGKPNQYIEKINWTDSRIKKSNTDCSIEIFNNSKDASARKTYIENIIKTTPIFKQYIVQKDNTLLRIQGSLTKKQANEYINEFNNIK